MPCALQSVRAFIQWQSPIIIRLKRFLFLWCLVLSGLSPLSIGFSGVSVDEADGRRVALWQQPHLLMGYIKGLLISGSTFSYSGTSSKSGTIVQKADQRKLIHK